MLLSNLVAKYPHLPNGLSLLRIGLIVPICLLTAINTPIAVWLAFLLFVIAALSDWVDGWLARHYQLQSHLGQVLDYTADKLLVVALLLVLTYVHSITAWSIAAAFLILLREVAIGGLREFLSKTEINLPSSPLGKQKTVVQFVALGLLILGNHGPALAMTRIFGELLLWLAAALTIVSGYEYIRAGWTYLVSSVRGKG